jgi:hypothetical protein
MSNERVVPTRIVQDTSREVEAHMMGEYVAVAWSMRKEKVPVEIHGQKTSAEIWVRLSIKEPYIAFYWVREYSGVPCIAEDSSVAGGLSTVSARVVAKELTMAAAYIEQLAREGYPS